MASIRAEGIDPAVQKIIAVAVLSLLFLPRFGGIQGQQTEQGGFSLAILIVIDGLLAQCICFRQKAPHPVIFMRHYAKAASAPGLFLGPAPVMVLVIVVPPLPAPVVRDRHQIIVDIITIAGKPCLFRLYLESSAGKLSNYKIDSCCKVHIITANILKPLVLHLC